MLSTHRELLSSCTRKNDMILRMYKPRSGQFFSKFFMLRCPRHGATASSGVGALLRERSAIKPKPPPLWRGSKDGGVAAVGKRFYVPEGTGRVAGTSSGDIPVVNHQALSSFIWSVADLLRGDYKQSGYGNVIPPFTVLTGDCLSFITEAVPAVEPRGLSAYTIGFIECCIRASPR